MRVLVLTLMISFASQGVFGASEGSDSLQIQKLKKIVSYINQKYKKHIINPLQQDGSFKTSMDSTNPSALNKIIKYSLADHLSKKAPTCEEDIFKACETINTFRKQDSTAFLMCRDMCFLLSKKLLENGFRDFFWQQSRSKEEDVFSTHCYLVYKLANQQQIVLCSWSNHCPIITDHIFQEDLNYIFPANSLYRHIFSKEVLFRVES